MKSHAVVAGGSIAGLLAARVLSDHFAKVTVLEKDHYPAEPRPRPCVPQGRHLHILLPSGADAIESLLPGTVADLIGDGAKCFDYGHSRIYIYGAWLPRVQTGLKALAQSRPLLEQHVRRRVAKIANIEIIYEAVFRAPILDRSRSRVTGVEFARLDCGTSERISADLVVDATGRNTPMVRWLTESGFGRVPETRVGINLGYATGRFRVPEELLPDSTLLYVVGPPPGQTKVGVIFQAENGIVYGGMGGYQGDHPPGDVPGFLRFARSLSQPDIFRVLSHSEPCAEIERFQIPTSVRRRYHRLPKLPERFLPIGDSICSLDPAFGQGMTIAALEGKVLARCLENHPEPDRSFRSEYLRGVDALVDAAWNLSTRENLRYPRTTGPRPWFLPIASRYMSLVVTSGDPHVATNVYKVISLTAKPRTLLRPGVAVRALRAALRNAGGES